MLIFWVIAYTKHLQQNNLSYLIGKQAEGTKFPKAPEWLNHAAFRAITQAFQKPHSNDIQWTQKHNLKIFKHSEIVT